MVRILGLLFKHRTIIRIRFRFNPRCGTWGLLQTVHSSVILTAEDGFFVGLFCQCVTFGILGTFHWIYKCQGPGRRAGWPVVGCCWLWFVT